MVDYQKRVVAEKKDLDLKIDKLNQFLQSKPEVPAEELGRLRRQIFAMESYSAVLAERIYAFGINQ